MNTQEYIASGILENYLLDHCTPQEKQEVECLSKIYPEIKQELQSLELSLEKYLRAQAKTPPKSIWDAIEAEITESKAQSTAAEQEEDDDIEMYTEEGFDVVGETLKQEQNPKKGRIRHLFNYSAAAAVIFMGFFIFITFKSRQNVGSALEMEKNITQKLEEKLHLLERDFEQQQKVLAAITTPNAQRVAMKGMPNKAPDAEAYVVYNALSEEVYLNIGSLPANPSEKQYQLWALKDGQPIDLGVFDIGNATAFIAMKTVSGAQAFAVTLEDKGGKPTPNLEELYVMGQLQG